MYGERAEGSGEEEGGAALGAAVLLLLHPSPLGAPELASERPIAATRVIHLCQVSFS